MRTIIATAMYGGGVPRFCAICRHLVWIEASEPAGDAPCPSCGCLLWPGGRRARTSRGRRASRSRRLGAALQRAWQRSLKPVLLARMAVLRPKRRAAPTIESPTGSGLWDEWLDG